MLLNINTHSTTFNLTSPSYYKFPSHSSLYYTYSHLHSSSLCTQRLTFNSSTFSHIPPSCIPHLILLFSNILSNIFPSMLSFPILSPNFQFHFTKFTVSIHSFSTCLTTLYFVFFPHIFPLKTSHISNQFILAPFHL